MHQLDSTAWTALETYFTDQTWKGMFRLAEPEDFRTLMQDFAKSWELRIYWTSSGLLGIGVEDPTKETIYIDDPWVRWLGEALNWGMPAAPREAITALSIDNVFDSAQGGYKQSLELREPTRTEVRQGLSLRWSPSQE